MDDQNPRRLPGDRAEHVPASSANIDEPHQHHNARETGRALVSARAANLTQGAPSAAAVGSFRASVAGEARDSPGEHPSLEQGATPSSIQLDTARPLSPTVARAEMGPPPPRVPRPEVRPPSNPSLRGTTRQGQQVERRSQPSRRRRGSVGPAETAGQGQQVERRSQPSRRRRRSVGPAETAGQAAEPAREPFRRATPFAPSLANAAGPAGSYAASVAQPSEGVTNEQPSILARASYWAEFPGPNGIIGRALVHAQRHAQAEVEVYDLFDAAIRCWTQYLPMAPDLPHIFLPSANQFRDQASQLQTQAHAQIYCPTRRQAWAQFRVVLSLMIAEAGAEQQRPSSTTSLVQASFPALEGIQVQSQANQLLNKAIDVLYFLVHVQMQTQSAEYPQQTPPYRHISELFCALRIVAACYHFRAKRLLDEASGHMEEAEVMEKFFPHQTYRFQPSPQDLNAAQFASEHLPDLLEPARLGPDETSRLQAQLNCQIPAGGIRNPPAGPDAAAAGPSAPTWGQQQGVPPAPQDGIDDLRRLLTEITNRTAPRV